MKVCETCGSDIDGARDAETECRGCEDAGTAKRAKARAKARAARKAREDMLRSCGLVKVRGALGGTYWE